MNSRLSFRTTNDHHSHQMFCKVKLGQTAGAVAIEARLVNSLVRLCFPLIAISMSAR